MSVHKGIRKFYLITPNTQADVVFNDIQNGETRFNAEVDAVVKRIGGYCAAVVENHGVVGFTFAEGSTIRSGLEEVYGRDGVYRIPHKTDDSDLIDILDLMEGIRPPKDPKAFFIGTSVRLDGSSGGGVTSIVPTLKHHDPINDIAGKKKFWLVGVHRNTSARPVEGLVELTDKQYEALRNASS